MALVVATGTLVGVSPARAQLPADDPPVVALVKSVPMPAREHEYAALIERARADYRAAKSTDGRTAARAGLQIAVHRFMGLTHNAKDWIGIYAGGKRLENGSFSVEIEVAPDVTIATWDADYFDRAYGTMIKPYAPLAGTVRTLTIGQPVLFSADLLGDAVSTDEDMVLHPRIIARFTKLERLEDKPPQQ